jgi:hypothetical protein
MAFFTLAFKMSSVAFYHFGLIVYVMKCLYFLATLLWGSHLSLVWDIGLKYEF